MTLKESVNCCLERKPRVDCITFENLLHMCCMRRHPALMMRVHILLCTTVHLALWFRPAHAVISLLHPSNQWSEVEVEIAIFILEMLVPIQHALGVLYYNTSHCDEFESAHRQIFQEIISVIKAQCTTITQDGTFTDITREMSEDSQNSIQNYTCGCSFDRMAGIMLLTSLSASVAELTYSTINPIIYESEGYVASASLICMMVLTSVIGRMCVVVNCFTFVTIMWKHHKMLNFIIDYVSHKHTAWTKAKDPFKLSRIVFMLLKVKCSMQSSLHMLHGILVSATLFGGLTLAFLAHASIDQRSLVASKFIVGSLALFILVQCAFFYVVYSVNHALQALRRLFNGQKMTELFIYRAFSDTTTLVPNDDNTTQNGKILSIVNDTASSIDYLILQDLIDGSWIEVYIFGMPLHNGSFLRHLLGLGAFLILLVDFFDSSTL